jgi:hypothetical protein
MTGPEHYREAERLVEEANRVGHEDPARGSGILAAAQVHATLADAAATALNDADAGTPMPEWHNWRVAAGYPAKADRDFVAGQAAIEDGTERPR